MQEWTKYHDQEMKMQSAVLYIRTVGEIVINQNNWWNCYKLKLLIELVTVQEMATLIVFIIANGVKLF